MNFQTLRDDYRAAGISFQFDDDKSDQKTPIEIVREAADNIRPRKVSFVRAQLKLFRFEQADCFQDAKRINNMAWEFMQVDGMRFQDAITLAAQVVAHCDVAACEAGYVDVKMLWERINQPMVR